MADVKMTKAQMFNEVIALAETAGRDDVVEFAKHEIELLAKRNSADSKAKQAKAAERAALGDKIVEFLAARDNAVAALEIATAIGISTQKATPILKSLVEDGRVAVATEKRKNFYSIVA